MKSLSIFFKIGVAMLLIISFPLNDGHAETKNAGSEYLMQLGLRELEKGDSKQAVIEFRKAYMLDPTNEEAQIYLSQLGIDLRTLRPANSVSSSHIASFEERIYKLEQARMDMERKFIKVQSRNSDLVEMKRVRDLEISVLQDKLHDIAEISDQEDLEVDQKFEQIQKMSKEIKQVYLPHREEVQRILSDNAEMKPITYLAPSVEMVQMQPSEDVTLTEILDDIDHGYELQAIDDQLSKTRNYKRMLEESKFEYQDKLIHVLEDYLNLREESLSIAQDDVIDSKIETLITEIAYLGQNKELYDIHNLFVEESEDGRVRMINQLYEDVQDVNIDQYYHINRQDEYIKYLEDDLQEASLEARRLLRSKEELLNSVIHEVK